MKQKPPNASAPAAGDHSAIEDSLRLSRAILHCANRGLPRAEFLGEVSTLILDFSGGDAVEVRLNDGDLHYRWQATRRPESTIRFEPVRWTVCDDGRVIPASHEQTDLERLCRDVALQDVDASLPWFTSDGSFWTGDTWASLSAGTTGTEAGSTPTLCIGGHYRSLALMRFVVDIQTVGLLQIKSQRPNCFSEKEVEFYEGVAQTLGLAVADRRAQAALRERVKELTCLYGIAQIIEGAPIPLKETIQCIVQLLPPAWQYPEITAARITLDDSSYMTRGFQQSRYRQAASIVVGGRRRGLVEVVYLEEKPELAAGPFLVEEEKLIDAVAREVALIVERKEAREEKSTLQQQLIHADRLATIGQLSAGVAHELNEPLGSILGFAQLAHKCPDLPQQAAQDVEKIVTASLYAREVIKKLMVFARQMPSNKVQVNLNRVVEDGLYFLEARCTKAGIQVVRALAPGLPEIIADPAQLNQVLVNLVVNAVQAMPGGGTLTVTTRPSASSAMLIVEDTGTGMSDEVRAKIFLPFFTTKDVDEGTGLGLAVVHGIVTSHGGTISVDSQPARGTRFEIRIPMIPPEDLKEVGQDGASA